MIHSIGTTSPSFDKFDKKVKPKFSKEKSLVKKKMGSIPILPGAPSQSPPPG
jgi:hypothetical protein